jgi:O-antigen ligase
MKLVHFGLLAISLRVVMLTQSRTAFLGVIAFGAVAWLYSKNKLASIFIAILASIIIWQFMPEETQDRFLTLFQVKTAITVDRSDFTEDEALAIGSMQSRWELIRRSFLCFLDNPVLGVGLGNFPAYNWYRWGYWFPPHNTYLQALAEIGIIGFIIFLMVIITTFKNLKYSKELLQRIENENKFLFFMIQALSVYLIVRLVVTTFGQDLYSNFWWLAGGLSVVIYRIAKMKHKRFVDSKLESSQT